MEQRLGRRPEDDPGRDARREEHREVRRIRVARFRLGTAQPDASLGPDDDESANRTNSTISVRNSQPNGSSIVPRTWGMTWFVMPVIGVSTSLARATVFRASAVAMAPGVATRMTPSARPSGTATLWATPVCVSTRTTSYSALRRSRAFPSSVGVGERRQRLAARDYGQPAGGFDDRVLERRVAAQHFVEPGLVLESEERAQVRHPEVGVDDDCVEPAFLERRSQVDGDCALSDATLAAPDCTYVPGHATGIG